MNEKKNFFGRHAKSSAALVSLGVHAAIIVMALFFVAVTVIQKDDVDFEARPVSRPNMKLRKLQLPANIKKPPPQPKLRKQIVVKMREQKLPDIKMPEIVGVKGGLGAAGSGLGGGLSLGFTMPEFNILGVKARGQRVFIVLDASDPMLLDNVGGIPAYTLIKEELLRVLGGLNSTVVFNIAISDYPNQVVLFENMVPATPANVAKVKEWIASLNTWDPATNKKTIGFKSLGSGGVSLSERSFQPEPLQGTVCRWGKPAFVAMEQQADVVFLLLRSYDFVGYTSAPARAWTEEEEEQWKKAVEQAYAMHREENEKRKQKGLPPRVVGDNRQLVRAYLPNVKHPPDSKYTNHEPRELAQALENVRREKGKQEALASRLKASRPDHCTINVIQFVPEDGDEDKELKMLASLFRGEYRKVEGLAAIQSLAGRANGGE